MSDAQQNELPDVIIERAAYELYTVNASRALTQHETEDHFRRAIQSALEWNKRAEISVSEDTKRLDWMEANHADAQYLNGTGFTWNVFTESGDIDEGAKTIREAIDAAMARDDVDRRDSSGAQEEGLGEKEAASDHVKAVLQNARKLASKIVGAVLRELLARRAIVRELELAEDEVRAEVERTLTEKAEKVILSEHAPKSDSGSEYPQTSPVSQISLGEDKEGEKEHRALP